MAIEWEANLEDIDKFKFTEAVNRQEEYSIADLKIKRERLVNELTEITLKLQTKIDNIDTLLAEADTLGLDIS